MGKARTSGGCLLLGHNINRGLCLSLPCWLVCHAAAHTAYDVFMLPPAHTPLSLPTLLVDLPTQARTPTTASSSPQQSPSLCLPTMLTCHAMPCHAHAGAHTDYGMLTFLVTDLVPGLQIHTQGAWMDVPPRWAMQTSWFVDLWCHSQRRWAGAQLL